MMTDQMWARGAIRRKPVAADFLGLSYEAASRRALEICKAAIETGRTINAGLHLAELAGTMNGRA